MTPDLIGEIIQLKATLEAEYNFESQIHFKTSNDEMNTLKTGMLMGSLAALETTLARIDRIIKKYDSGKSESDLKF